MRDLVRVATPEDRGILSELISEYLGVDGSTRLRWMYDTNPHGRAITWLAFERESGAATGMTSFFPRRLWVDGEVVTAAWGGDGYVRPAARGRGIGSALHAAARQDMKELGIQVMFGTPSTLNQGPLSRAGALDVDETVRYTRPLVLPSWLVARSRTLRLDPMSELDPRVDELWRRFVGDMHGRGIATVRDAAFYTWRFLRAPSHRQRPYVIVDGERPVAACCLEQLGDAAYVVDLVTTAADLGLALQALRRAAEGHRAIHIKMSRQHPLARRLWRHGFFARDRSKPLNVLVPDGASPSTPFHDPGRWYFTWAESDQDSLAR